MAILLSIVGLATGLAGTLLFGLVAFIPKIGPGPVLKATVWKTLLAIVSITLAGAAYWLHPNTGYLVSWTFTGLLGILTYVIYPDRVFATLRFPVHLPAQTADLGDNASILGFVANGEACAWPMEIVIPRHLIHDRVGNIPILVAY